MSSNLTAAHPTIPQFHPVFHAYPIYHSPAHSLLTPLSDHHLAVLAPVIAYWVTSGIFHILDSSNWAWLDGYRIHDSAEVASRNRASRLAVLLAVLLQQLIQTVLGLLWVSEVPEHTDHATAMRSIAHYLVSSFGLFDEAAPQLAYLLYWWLIPAAQMFFAMCVKSCSFSLAADLFFIFYLKLGWCSTRGNTSSTARCTSTGSCSSTSTRSITGCMCPTRMVRFTTILSKAFCSTRSVPCSPSPSRNSQFARRCFSSSFPPAKQWTTTAGIAYRSTRSKWSAATRQTTTTYTTRPSASNPTFLSPGSSTGTPSSAPA